MSDITMPEEFTAIKLGTYQGGVIDKDARDEPDIGPARIRKKTTRKYQAFKYENWPRTIEKCIEFRDWIMNTAEGTLNAFNWTDVLTGETYELRFSVYPTWKPVRDGLWKFELSLEEV